MVRGWFIYCYLLAKLCSDIWQALPKQIFGDGHVEHSRLYRKPLTLGPSVAYSRSLRRGLSLVSKGCTSIWKSERSLSRSSAKIKNPHHKMHSTMGIGCSPKFSSGINSFVQV